MSVLENPGVRLKKPRYRLSQATAAVFAMLLVTGITEGAAEYTRRSPRIEQHVVAGTNAITVHVFTAAAAAAAVISIQA